MYYFIQHGLISYPFKKEDRRFEGYFLNIMREPAIGDKLTLASSFLMGLSLEQLMRLKQKLIENINVE
ncbi:MAG: hypothetical protein A6F72_00075 [Cycloclasticus sp. symbiont of Poecilosclerida sp. N]|nr:MAG: hypothetical protein A6F72_00075 [Cycloclasticus sp. symbiont of Poecilosclerida sp. N]